MVTIGCYTLKGKELFRYHSPEVPQVGDVVHTIPGATIQGEEKSYLVERREWCVSIKDDLPLALLYLEELPHEQEVQEGSETQASSGESSPQVSQEAALSELRLGGEQLEAGEAPPEKEEEGSISS